MLKHLKTYQLFESLEITEWSDIKDMINVVEDEFNFEFKELKVIDDSSYGGAKIVSFIFTGREWIGSSYKKDQDIYKWFIQQIVNTGKFLHTNGQWMEVIKLKKDYRVIASSRNFSKIEFPEGGVKLTDPRGLTDIEILKLGSSKYEYHINFKATVTPGLEWAIMFPQDKDLLRALNPDMVIKHIFQYYCKRHHDIHFNILSVFSDKPDKLITPVKKRDIQLPYTLSEQFIIDITPIFLEKVFNASGLIFRLQISRYEAWNVVNTDRLRGHSIAQETDEKLKELGLDMTWRDIFIIENQ